ncbi:invasion associated locus B family protein [Parvularcula sp. LCG005]|uniref:invasion associated locus B family protein n=1 Tax=Parvularcula sp. LCG005 TaxID=3078805 RepID=UPI0029432CE6|nr:invasion associated locus B family protein [Parvularcula sp. LCG005]WOI53405.1 invasion associated locus B family protein [Parvularcula sp. LCG005]
MTRHLSALLAAVVFAPVVAQAAEPEQVATYRDWIVYSADLGTDTLCYAVTEASDKEPSAVNHGDVFFMVSTWKSGVAANQPSFMAGYTLRDRPEPMIRIGSDKWDMFTAGSEGFVETDSDEKSVVGAMRRGSEMRVSAMSERGTATEYTFSLLGISNALDRVERACR